MSDAIETFAARLKRFRDAAGLSLSDLATAAGISKTYLWELEKDDDGKSSPSLAVVQQLAAALSVGLLDLAGADKPWPRNAGVIKPMKRPITEEWLIANGFRIESGRNDARMPLRSLVVGGDFICGHRLCHSPEDLCIDVAPTDNRRDEWFVWIAQREPYRHIHVRHMTMTWELVRLYEGLAGRVWPGEL